MREPALQPYSGDPLWSLRGLRLFADLTPAELRELSPFMRTETYRRGASLFYMGDRADRLYFLQKGTVKAIVVSTEGQERILDVFHAGDMFGELFLMTVTRRIFAAQAVTNVVVHSMAEGAFMTLLATHPDLSRNFVRHLIRQYRRTILRFQSLLSAGAGPKLLMTLLDVGERIGRRVHGSYLLPAHTLTQGDLAEMTGLHRSTVSTLINRYRAQRLLGGQGTRLTIRRARVERLLERSGMIVSASTQSPPVRRR